MKRCVSWCSGKSGVARQLQRKNICILRRKCNIFLRCPVKRTVIGKQNLKGLKSNRLLLQTGDNIVDALNAMICRDDYVKASHGMEFPEIVGFLQQ